MTEERYEQATAAPGEKRKLSIARTIIEVEFTDEYVDNSTDEEIATVVRLAMHRARQ